MDFGFDARTEELRASCSSFMDDHVYPAEPVFARAARRARRPRGPGPRAGDRGAARRGARRAACGTSSCPAPHGAGLTNLQYAPLAEITGRSPHLAPEALNCAAPDTGNMEVLAEFGTRGAAGALARAAAGGRDPLGLRMTEPDVASSDATNIATRIDRDGDDYVDQRPQVVDHRRDEPELRRSSS